MMFSSSIAVPETWESLEEFATWYLDSQLPYRIPEDAELFRSDDASALCVFRHGQFQVEQYFIDDIYRVKAHAHPGVEVMQVSMVTVGLPFGEPTNHIQSGEFHGGKGQPSDPCRPGSILAFERWQEGLKPTTVAARWHGPLVGPLHRAIVTRFYPEVRIVDDYVHFD
jgi:hypothetical protein